MVVLSSEATTPRGLRKVATEHAPSVKPQPPVVTGLRRPVVPL